MTKKHAITLFAALTIFFCIYACAEDNKEEAEENPKVEESPKETQTSQSQAAAAEPVTGFLVLAPDRGFVGDEEIKDSFAGFAERNTAELAFVTGEDYEGNVHEALKKLEARGAATIWVLPLFLSESDVRYEKGVNALKSYKGSAALGIAESFGENYLAEEILADRIRALSHSPSDETLVVLGSGAVDEESAQAIKEDLERITAGAAGSMGFKDTEVVVLYSWDAEDGPKYQALKGIGETIAAASQDRGRIVIVPFNLSMKLTGMMSEWGMFKHSLAPYPGAVYDGKDVLPHDYVALWFDKKANERLPFTDEEIGVAYMPHGSDYNWNQMMSEAVGPLKDKYMIENAFSMGEIDVVERAVRKLEARGAKAIVVLRVFSLESSFKEGTEHMLGLTDGEDGADMHHGAHGHGSGHGDGHGDAHSGAHHGHGAGTGSTRIPSSALFVTLGGLEDDPLFAEAMADRVKELSTDPGSETVILLGHGTDDEETNNRWLDNLKSLGNQISDKTGLQFRDVKYYTWREDWPDKREKSIEVIRGMVEEASKDGGTAIVIPVRTTGEGHERKYLEGLEYRLGSGFAPHPNYVKWVESNIEEGVKSLRQDMEERNAAHSLADHH